jgi:hypothetical protein
MERMTPIHQEFYNNNNNKKKEKQRNKTKANNKCLTKISPVRCNNK